MKNLERLLTLNKFASFSVVHKPERHFENRSLYAGGIRVTILDDVCEIWCPRMRFWDICDEVRAVYVLLQLLYGKYVTGGGYYTDQPNVQILE